MEGLLSVNSVWNPAGKTFSGRIKNIVVMKQKIVNAGERIEKQKIVNSNKNVCWQDSISYKKKIDIFVTI